MSAQARVATEWVMFGTWPTWMQDTWFEVTISEFVKWSWKHSTQAHRCDYGVGSDGVSS